MAQLEAIMRLSETTNDTGRRKPSIQDVRGGSERGIGVY